MTNDAPTNRLPPWDTADLPEPKPMGWRNLAGLIGPGIVMCGIQIGGGEWLFGPAITAKYGGGLMWIATIAIIVQVFYNIECGRYALYCGEPVFTGFLRTKPGPRFWIGVVLFLNLASLIPGLTTNAAVLITTLYLDRPPMAPGVGEGDELAVVEIADDDRHETIFQVGSPELPIATTDTGVRLSGTAIAGTTVELLRVDGDDRKTLFQDDYQPAVLQTSPDGAWSLALRDDTFLVNAVAYLCLGIVVLPVLVGGKVYNTLQFVMTIKVVAVLSFCLLMGLFFVSSDGWANVFSGFVKFGNVPIEDKEGKEVVVNAFTHRSETGEWPVLALASIATLGAFAGYAGGGGLSNAAYSNFVRDKGWGMGREVGAIASAVGGRHISLSHVGKVFPITAENLRKWKAWWKYILCDQLIIWVPGCFMGMALPALLSIQFAEKSSMYGKDVTYSQPLIVADGMRAAPTLGEYAPLLSTAAIVVGLIVFLPSQMSVVDDVARRWTDIIWTSSGRVRRRLKPNQVSRVYYTILALYVVLSFVMLTIFTRYGQTDIATQMVTVIANLNNLAIGATAFHLLWINTRFLPRELRPRWYQMTGVLCCGVFYLGLAVLVFCVKIWPMIVS